MQRTLLTIHRRRFSKLTTLAAGLAGLPSRTPLGLRQWHRFAAAARREGSSTDRIRVAIVEDDAKLLSALGQLIGTDPEFEFIGGFPTTTSALAGIPSLDPDIVIMDINLPDIDGVECVRRLKEIGPPPQVLMLTVYEDAGEVFRALRAGATGYLLKQTPFHEVLTAIRDIVQGGSPMSSHIARKVVRSFQEGSAPNPEVETLSQREREVLELVAQGYLFKEIGEKLGVSFSTVHTYSRRIYEKLHVRSRAQAVAKFNQK